MTLDWVPFELHPEIPPEGRPRDAVLPAQYRARIDENLRLMAQETGLTLKVHERLINSRPALQAAEYARSIDQFEPMHRELFRAYWERGEDVSDGAVLRDVAARAGVDVDGMQRAVEENRYGDYLDARRAEAQELMIDGIPAHVIADRYLVMGAQPYDLFERVMARLEVPHRDLSAEPGTPSADD